MSDDEGRQPRVAVVTGGSRGVGRGIAIALGSHGYTVYVTGRTQQKGESPWSGTIHDTATAITAAGGQGVAARVDHRNDDEVEALFARVRAEEGRLDLLVNNAALIHDELQSPLPFWEKPLAASVDLLEVGLRSGLSRADGDSRHGERGLRARIFFLLYQSDYAAEPDHGHRGESLPDLPPIPDQPQGFALEGVPVSSVRRTSPRISSNKPTSASSRCRARSDPASTTKSRRTAATRTVTFNPDPVGDLIYTGASVPGVPGSVWSNGIQADSAYHGF